MPNRIIKESICTSENIESLEPMEEIFFYRLMVQCDDYGRMDGRTTILRAKCFPLKVNKIKDKDISKWLATLIEQELVLLYIVDDKYYLQMATWDKHQQVRAKRSKFPAPDDGLISNDINGYRMQADVPVIQSNPNPYPNPYPNPNPASGYDDDFEVFWSSYPRKKEKKKAFKQWQRLIKVVGYKPEVLTQAAKHYAIECRRKITDEKYIKLPATFLGPDQPFEDYFKPPDTTGNSKIDLLKTQHDAFKEEEEFDQIRND